MEQVIPRNKLPSKTIKLLFNPAFTNVIWATGNDRSPYMKKKKTTNKQTRTTRKKNKKEKKFTYTDLRIWAA